MWLLPSGLKAGWRLGLSKNGGMFGSDIVYYITSNPNTLTDAYIKRDCAVEVDGSQNWTLDKVTTEDGFLIVQAHQ
jgi:hypothetical protein